jgi:catechol 2,3-dioxygenase-like lactoylglutathione lyase family enzyme
VLGADRLTHWSLPVKNLTESEAFFGDFLGFDYLGPLGGPLATVSHASVFRVGESSFILWETGFDADPRLAEVGVHYGFTVLPEVWDRAIVAIHAAGVKLRGPIVYRAKGTFLGREVYMVDPSGNTIELTDPTWVEGMPEPTFEEIVGTAAVTA